MEFLFFCDYCRKYKTIDVQKELENENIFFYAGLRRMKDQLK